VVSAAGTGLSFGADLSSSLGNDALATQLAQANRYIKC
jgi:hypothetical protein